MKAESVLKSCCALVTDDEAHALYEALGQYVDNLREAAEADLWGENYSLKAKLRTAEALLEKMDSAIAALAG